MQPGYNRDYAEAGRGHVPPPPFAESSRPRPQPYEVEQQRYPHPPPQHQYYEQGPHHVEQCGFNKPSASYCPPGRSYPLLPPREYGQRREYDDREYDRRQEYSNRGGGSGYDERSWNGPPQGGHRYDADPYDERRPHYARETPYEAQERFRQPPPPRERYRWNDYDAATQQYPEGYVFGYEGGAHGRNEGVPVDVAPAWKGHAPKAGTQMRLVALASDVLPEGQKIAIIDARDEGVSIGRDRSFTARIRLPCMSISKHHANLFLMPANLANAAPMWCVTDAGSTHGSFHLAAAQVPTGDNVDAKNIATKRFTRLSEAKKASAPKGLNHGDWLRFGKGTTFEVHMHGAGAWACRQCSLVSDGSDEIPLKADESGITAGKAASSIPMSAAAAAGAALLDTPSADDSSEGAKGRARVDRKIELEAQRLKQMRQMRKHYLGEEEAPLNKAVAAAAASATSGNAIPVLGEEASSGKTPKYIDRAAARRAKNPGGPIPKRWGKRRSASPPAVGVPRPTTRVVRQASPPAAAPVAPPARAAPLDSSNVGFRMLQQMAGGAGASSDTASDARFAESIVHRGVEGRAGLGSVQLKDAEEIGASSMGVAWAQSTSNAAASAKATTTTRGAGSGYGSKDAVRRRYEQSLQAQGSDGS